MQKDILHKMTVLSGKKEKQLAVLLDPDKLTHIDKLIDTANISKVDYFFVGGSLLTSGDMDVCIAKIKEYSDIPVVLFPGSTMQISPSADAILFLSLISGRNPDLLIGQHVLAAPYLKKSGLEILPTGYMLVDSGKSTTASYISNTTPIPYEKADIAACTAMAGEMLGLKIMYLDAGSGAQQPVSVEMISAVKRNISLPLIVGGGIKTPELAFAACKAGADIVVVGNAFEQNPQLLLEISNAVHNQLLFHN